MNNDVTLIGNAFVPDGIGRQLISFLKLIHKDLKTNILQFPPTNLQGVEPEIVSLLNKPFDGQWGKIAFSASFLGINESFIDIHKSSKSPIKFAYCMIESGFGKNQNNGSAIPALWRDILNSYYDAVIVPDPFLISTYQKSGVRIPIFCIPLGISVEKLLQKEYVPRDRQESPFIFGMSAAFYGRKNHLKLLSAFKKKFGNSPNFKLNLHGRFGANKEEVIKAVSKANIFNVDLFSQIFTEEEYNSFLDDLDCLVYPSQGEGYSISPREMLALGKPAIVSNNTAQKTICSSGFVLPLKADIEVPAYYELFKQTLGCYYDCTEEDLMNAMQEMVDNYDIYLAKAKQGREWVRQYLWSNLKSRYMSLFSPKQIIFGSKNEITETYFKTNDKKLFRKMKENFV
jgi:glycosyltransferase involved in cell wall biosynthesis